MADNQGIFTDTVNSHTSGAVANGAGAPEEGSVRAHPETGYRQVAAKGRWINQDEPNVRPGEVLHNGFSKNPNTLSVTELGEVRRQVIERSRGGRGTAATRSEAALGGEYTEGTQAPAKSRVSAARAPKEPSILDMAAAAGKPLKNQNAMHADVVSHITGLKSHLEKLKGIAEAKGLADDHPAVRALSDAHDHLAAAWDQASEYNENMRPKDASGNRLTETKTVTKAGSGRKVGDTITTFPHNKTEAEGNLRTAALAVAGAHDLLTGKDTEEISGGMTPPVSVKDVSDNYAHTVSLKLFGHKGTGKQPNRLTLAGTTVYRSDPGVQGAIKRIKAGIATGDLQYKNFSPFALQRLNERGTRRFTAAQQREAGAGDRTQGRQALQESVQWGDRSLPSMGQAAVNVEGSRPYSGREGRVEAGGDIRPQQGPAAPARVEADAAEATARRAAEATQTPKKPTRFAELTRGAQEAKRSEWQANNDAEAQAAAEKAAAKEASKGRRAARSAGRGANNAADMRALQAVLKRRKGNN